MFGDDRETDRVDDPFTIIHGIECGELGVCACVDHIRTLSVAVAVAVAVATLLSPPLPPHAHTCNARDHTRKQCHTHDRLDPHRHDEYGWCGCECRDVCRCDAVCVEQILEEDEGEGEDGGGGEGVEDAERGVGEMPTRG